MGKPKYYPVRDKKMLKAVLEEALKNPWLNGTVDMEDGDPFGAIEHMVDESKISKARGLDALVYGLLNYTAVGSGFIYKNLAFISQDPYGEWAVFVYDKETNKAMQIDSITTGGYGGMDKKEIKAYVKRLLKVMPALLEGVRNNDGMWRVWDRVKAYEECDDPLCKPTGNYEVMY